jgi:hypothetical protein
MPLLDPIPSPVENADLAALEWEPLLSLVSGFAASSMDEPRSFGCALPLTKNGLRGNIG